MNGAAYFGVKDATLAERYLEVEVAVRAIGLREYALHIPA